MADVDIDPFGKHDKTDVQPDEPRAKPFLSTPGGVIEGGSTWEPEQETSFGGGKTQSTRLKKVCVKGLYRKLSETTGQHQKPSISMILKSEIGNCTTETTAHP